MNRPVKPQDRELLRDCLTSELSAQREVLEQLIERTLELAKDVKATLEDGGTVFWLGNGGSAAQAQHAACELLGRFATDREPLRSLSLFGDPSSLTGIANDYGYEEVFARQIRALARPGDIVIGLSTSGRSENVLRALAAARGIGVRTACLTGADTSAVDDHCDHLLAAGLSTTARVQEVHLRLIHAIVDWVEQTLEKGL